MTTETRAAFARRMSEHLGREVARSTVTRWVEAGRVILRGDLVDVEESLALLQGTQGGRPDVSDRHAQDHIEKSAGAAYGRRDGIATAPATSQHDVSLEKARRIRAVSEARIKAAEAEIREMERDKEAGRLLDVDVVKFVMDDYGASVRSLLETLADRLAPVVYPLQTLEETHAAISDAGEAILIELADAQLRQAKLFGDKPE